jgi:hypothetical protein
MWSGGGQSSKPITHAIGVSLGSFGKEESEYYASGNTTSKDPTKTVWQNGYRILWENAGALVRTAEVGVPRDDRPVELQPLHLKLRRRVLQIQR